MTYQNILIKIFSLDTNNLLMKKEITTIELFIIEAVKSRRKELSVNPSKLALEIGLNRNFIRRIESLDYNEKYTFNQLNEIAKVLKCKIADFLPDPYLEEDCLEEYHVIREERLEKLKNQKKKSS